MTLSYFAKISSTANWNLCDAQLIIRTFKRLLKSQLVAQLSLANALTLLKNLSKTLWTKSVDMICSKTSWDVSSPTEQSAEKSVWYPSPSGNNAKIAPWTAFGVFYIWNTNPNLSESSLDFIRLTNRVRRFMNILGVFKMIASYFTGHGRLRSKHMRATGDNERCQEPSVNTTYSCIIQKWCYRRSRER